MPSRGEQLQSYQFMVQRVVSALVLRETDPPQSPFRRAASAAFASVLVTVIIAAGFGVYSIFTGGGNRKWQNEGTVVMEKGTGAIFLFSKGRLHPALNLTSALLASESPKPPVMTVSPKSLQGVAWGNTIGIPLLPNSLADKKNLVRYPWSVCAMQTKEGAVAVVVAGDDKLRLGQKLNSDRAFIVRAEGSKPYVLWNGRLYETSAPVAERLAPGMPMTLVSSAFINGLPKGEPIQPHVPNRGQVSKFNAAWTVGEVLTVRGVTAEDSFVLVRDDGLFFVTQLQAQIAPISSLHAISISEATVNGKPPSDDLMPKDNDPRRPPMKLPTFAPYTGSGLCSVMQSETVTELFVDVPLDLNNRPMTAGRKTNKARVADYIIMPDGKGAIVASGQTLNYVSRDGVRFAAANPEVLGKLGYGDVPAVKLAPSLVSLLPEGPGLDPAEATVQVSVS